MRPIVRDQLLLSPVRLWYGCMWWLWWQTVRGANEWRPSFWYIVRYYRRPNETHRKGIY